MTALSNFKISLFALMTVCFAATGAWAQAGHSPQDADIDAVLARAEQRLGKGESCFAAGEMDCARRAFDFAIDAFLESGLNARSDERLHKGWRTLIEKINRYQLDALSDERAQLWKTQEFDERPDPIAQVEETDLKEAENGPLTSQEFQRRFNELQKLFQKKYKREFIVTGEDHGEHRRLYGAGSAVDVRVRDLSREQVEFIISTGARFGLRVKDFSTQEKVEAHNARTVSLGRPLDTLATGPHLHIDRMASPKNGRATTKVVTIKKRGDASRKNR